METPAAGGEPTIGLLCTPKAETPQSRGWLWGILAQPRTPALVDVTEAKDLYGEENPENYLAFFQAPNSGEKAVSDLT